MGMHPVKHNGFLQKKCSRTAQSASTYFRPSLVLKLARPLFFTITSVSILLSNEFVDPMRIIESYRPRMSADGKSAVVSKNV